MTSTIAYFCARGGRGQCLPRFFPSRRPHTFSDEYCQLWRSRSMSKLNTTTLWCDDVYCDLLRTSDSITLGTDRGNILWLFSIPWLWNGYLLNKCFGHQHLVGALPSAFMCTCACELQLSGRKYFHKKSILETSSHFPHCCLPGCSDPCSSGPLLQLCVCLWLGDPQKRVGNQFTKLAPIHCTTAP